MAKKEGVPGGGQGGACPRAALARRGVSGTRRCGLPSLSPACPAAAVPCGGARLFWLPAYPTFSFVLAPLPRRGRISPRPPSRREGGDQGFFMQGASPLASPGAEPGRRWGRAQRTRPTGAEAGCYNKFEESSGGFGGLFQESPGASLPLATPRGAEPGRCWLRSTTHSGKFWGVRGTLSRVPRRLSPLKRRGKCDREPFCAGYRGGQSRRGGSRI